MAIQLRHNQMKAKYNQTLLWQEERNYDSEKPLSKKNRRIIARFRKETGMAEATTAFNNYRIHKLESTPIQ